MIEKKIEKYLTEQMSGRFSDKPVNRVLMRKVASDCDWNLNEVFDFVLELLEDVNAHSEYRAVAKIFHEAMRDYR